jgi:hypothetical protein
MLRLFGYDEKTLIVQTHFSHTFPELHQLLNALCTHQNQLASTSGQKAQQKSAMLAVLFTTLNTLIHEFNHEHASDNAYQVSFIAKLAFAVYTQCLCKPNSLSDPRYPTFDKIKAVLGLNCVPKSLDLSYSIYLETINILDTLFIPRLTFINYYHLLGLEDFDSIENVRNVLAVFNFEKDDKYIAALFKEINKTLTTPELKEAYDTRLQKHCLSTLAHS